MGIQRDMAWKTAARAVFRSNALADEEPNVCRTRQIIIARGATGCSCLRVKF